MHFYQQMNWQTTDIISSASNSPLLVHNHSNDVTLLQLASLYTISIIQSAARHYNSQLSAAVGVPQPTQSTSFQRRSSLDWYWQTKQCRKIHKLNTTQKTSKTKYNKNKTTLVQWPLTTLGQEMSWSTYYTALPGQHAASEMTLTTCDTFSLADLLSIFSRSVLCFLSAPLGCVQCQNNYK